MGCSSNSGCDGFASCQHRAQSESLPPELPGAFCAPDGLLSTDSRLPLQVPRPRPLTGDRFGGNYQKSGPSILTQRGHRDGGKTQEENSGLAYFSATHEDAPGRPTGRREGDPAPRDTETTPGPAQLGSPQLPELEQRRTEGTGDWRLNGKQNLPRGVRSAGWGTGLTLSLWEVTGARVSLSARVTSSVWPDSQRVKHRQLFKPPTPYALLVPDSCACAGHGGPLPGLANRGCGSAP